MGRMQSSGGRRISQDKTLKTAAAVSGSGAFLAPSTRFVPAFFPMLYAMLFSMFFANPFFANSVNAAEKSPKKSEIQIVHVRNSSQFLNREIEVDVQSTALVSENQFSEAGKWIERGLQEAREENPNVRIQLILEDDLSAARVGYGDSELRKLARAIVPFEFSELSPSASEASESKASKPHFFLQHERIILSVVRFVVSGGAALWSLHLGVDDSVATNEALVRAIPGSLAAALMSSGLAYHNDWYLRDFLGKAKLKLWGVEVGKLGRWYGVEVLFLALAKGMSQVFGISPSSSLFHSALEVGVTAMVGMIGQGSLELLNEKQTEAESKKFWNEPDRVKFRSRLRGVVISGFAVVTTLAAISTDSVFGVLSLAAYSGYGGYKYIREWLKDRKKISSCARAL